MPPKQKKVPVASRSKPQTRIINRASAGRGKVVSPDKKQQVCGVPAVSVLKKTTVSSKTKKLAWSVEDEMACKIQAAFRRYRSQKLLLELQQKKKEYDDTIEQLQKEAFLQIVKIEQEKAAKERMREEEDRRRRQIERNRIKRMLEAAFDGEDGEILAILDEVAKAHSEAGDLALRRFQYKIIECCDQNNNTPLSEAAAGGHHLTVSLLIKHGVNPNVKGQYGRTPLYRAAFAGHVEAVKVLLRSGADPRIYADDGATPEQVKLFLSILIVCQVSAHHDLEPIFQQWDMKETKKMLLWLEEERRRRTETDERIWKNQQDKIQSEIEEAEKEHNAKQKELMKAQEELNKRINEHDKSENTKPELTLTAIHDAEELLEKCKVQADAARKKLQEAKLTMRMKRKEFQPDLELNNDDQDEITADVVVNIREMDDVLIRDVGNKITESNKWPLIIDSSKQCATFLMYRDTNYLNAVNPRHMEPENILLGAILFGKFAVLDLSNVENFWPAVVKKFDAVQENLLPALISKDFIKEERYLKLLKPTDGDQYTVNHFLSARIHNFKLVIVTQLPVPPSELIGKTYIMKIHIPELNIV